MKAGQCLLRPAIALPVEHLLVHMKTVIEGAISAMAAVETVI